MQKEATVIIGDANGREWEETMKVYSSNVENECKAVVVEYNSTEPEERHRKFIRLVKVGEYKTLEDFSDEEKKEMYDEISSGGENADEVSKDHNTKNYILSSICGEIMNREEEEK